MKKNPRIALVYDRANTPFGGAEQVLLALHQAFPKAPLFTSVYHPRATWARNFKIKTSFLQKIPFAKNFHRYFVPLMPLAFESLDLSEYEIIISVTSAEAKGIITRPEQLHICYLLTPTRYLYSHRAHYEQTHWPFKVPIIRFFSQKLFDYITWWDQVAAHRPDVMIPISQLVKTRAEKYYKRELKAPIYPPFNPTELTSDSEEYSLKPFYLPDEYFLIISRLVPYKRIDLAIRAAQKLNKNLVIIGSGPDFNRLQKIASEKIFFLGQVSLIQKKSILSQAKAVLMPGLEDFGITAIEALLSQKQIILHQNSGAAELIKKQPGVILLKKLSISDLTTALKKVDSTSRITKRELKKLHKKLMKYAINNFVAVFKKTAPLLYNKERAL